MTQGQPHASPLRLLLPFDGWDQELLVPAEVVTSIMLPAVEHAVGHIVLAAHFKAVIFGIAVGFLPEKSTQGIFFQAIYGWEDCPAATQCIVKAAGPAADLLYRGGINDDGAKWDLREIETLSGVRSLEPYLSEAKSILSSYEKEVEWVSRELRTALTDGKERRMQRLPTGRMVAFLLDESQLRACP